MEVQRRLVSLESHFPIALSMTIAIFAQIHSTPAYSLGLTMTMMKKKLVIYFKKPFVLKSYPKMELRTECLLAIVKFILESFHSSSKFARCVRILLWFVCELIFCSVTIRFTIRNSLKLCIYLLTVVVSIEYKIKFFTI